LERTTLNTIEVAEYLGLSRDFVYALVARNEIKHIRIGSRIIFKKTSIDEWLTTIERGGNPDEPSK